MPPTIARLARKLTLVLLPLLGLPSAAHAGPIFAEFAFPLSYFDLRFGPDVGHAEIDSVGFGDGDDMLIGPGGEFTILSGAIHLYSGALLGVVPFGADAVYEHAPGGWLGMEFDLLLPDGSIHSGTFSAPLGAFTIYADGAGGSGDAAGALGPGVFDRGTAHLLGIKARTLATPWGAFLYLDSYDSYPDTDRTARAFGYLDVDARVPEPALLLLMATGAVAVVWRLRARARRRRI